MNWQRIVIVLVPIGLLLWILASGFGRDPRALPEMVVGEPAPQFALKTLDGKDFSLADHRGKPVVINFWATFCEPCKAEHVSIQRTAQSFGERVQFVGVVYQEESQVAARFLSRTLNTFPQLEDPLSETAIAYGVSGVPETFFISPEGKVMRRVAGFLDRNILLRELGVMLGGR